MKQHLAAATAQPGHIIGQAIGMTPARGISLRYVAGIDKQVFEAHRGLEPIGLLVRTTLDDGSVIEEFKPRAGVVVLLPE